MAWSKTSTSGDRATLGELVRPMRVLLNIDLNQVLHPTGVILAAVPLIGRLARWFQNLH